MAVSTPSAYPECVAATWLGERLAVDPARIEAMRRAGELIAVRRPGTTEWLYPAWQLERWTPRSGVARVVRAARDAGIPDERLYEIMTAPLGLTRGRGGRRLADLLVEGRIDDVVVAVRSA
jgi:hypothetical protein